MNFKDIQSYFRQQLGIYFSGYFLDIQLAEDDCCVIQVIIYDLAEEENQTYHETVYGIAEELELDELFYDVSPISYTPEYTDTYYGKEYKKIK